MKDTKTGAILGCRGVWTGNYSGHPEEVMATVCVTPHTQGRLCQHRAMFIQVAYMAGDGICLPNVHNLLLPRQESMSTEKDATPSSHSARSATG